MYSKIKNTGITKNLNKDETKRVTLLNTYLLIWVHISLVFILLDVTFKPPFAIIDIVIHVAAIGFISFLFLLNYLNKFLISKILFLALCYVIFSLLSFHAASSSYTIIYFTIIPAIALSLFRNNSYALVCLIIGILIFNLGDLLWDIPVTKRETLRRFVLLKDPTVLGLFFSVYYIVLYFKKLNAANEKLLAIERDNALSDKIILEKQEIELRELNSFKSHFFINLSHEIRTPVTLIKGYTSKLNLKSEKNKENLNIVNSQIQQIEDILNNILDLSKLDENKLIIDRSNIQLIPFLDKHFGNFKELFNQKNINFSLNNNIHNINVFMDANLMSKSINNLLNNALKFTEKKGYVGLNIVLQENLEIQITDNGIGIPDKDLDKIFNRFYQSKNEITKSQGSGIGLSFTKSIIEAHEFSLEVKSIPNIETVFKIIIPTTYINSTILDIENKVNSNLKPSSITTIIKKTPNKPTLLIVDDHEQMRNYLTSTLSKYNIIEAENGKEALDLLKSNSIDLLVTDYMMPIMDGETLVTEIKKLKLKIPIIVLTARVDDLAKLNMLRIGVDGYLNKPFVEEELKLFVQNSLQLYGNILENQETLSIEEKEELNDHANNFHKKITNYIENNITNLDLTTQDIAEYLNISKSTLNRRVKAILGQTANQIILQVKIEKARELQIKNPYLSKKEIGFSVGIKNTTYLFNKIAEKYGEHYNYN